MRFFILVCMLTSLAHAQDPGGDDAMGRAIALLRTTPLIDGHNDLPWMVREVADGDFSRFDLKTTLVGDTNIPRLRAGQVGAQFWSVWIPPELGGEGYARMQLEQIELVHRMIETYPETFQLALTADDIEQAYAAGRIASLIGMEGGYGLENSLGALRAYFRLGVRYMTLAHWNTLDWADSATDEARHDGLNAFGVEVVREMNRLGVLVDLAHVSAATMHDALDHSRAPVIFSHSLAYALVNHPRNVPDEVLRRLPENGGIIMASFVPEYLSSEVNEWARGFGARLPDGHYTTAEYDRIRHQYMKENGAVLAGLSDVADHLDHLRKVAGPDHIGIGSDFWGSDDLPTGLEDASKFPALFAELIRRGWSDEDLKKLAGQNMLRVMRKAEAVARDLQESTAPSMMRIDQQPGRRR
ncbi:MAG: dipeptidase [Xanthomonadales bacterium]|nr:dipeptidase [Xanthomonadales bacterium]